MTGSESAGSCSNEKVWCQTCTHTCLLLDLSLTCLLGVYEIRMPWSPWCDTSGSWLKMNAGNVWREDMNGYGGVSPPDRRCASGRRVSFAWSCRSEGRRRRNRRSEKEIRQSCSWGCLSRRSSRSRAWTCIEQCWPSKRPSLLRRVTACKVHCPHRRKRSSREFLL
jgi:hypothetical protein